MLHRFRFRAMASPCELQLHGADAGAVGAAARAAIAEVLRIERKYSRYRDDSVAACINASAGSPAGVPVDAETAALLDYAHTAWQQSEGLFDISSGVLREAWDFRSGRVPRPEQVERALARVGWQRVEWKDRRIRLPAGMQIDFGGYGKEYAADRAAAVCREQGIHGGVVDLGGDVAIVGPHPDGEPWRVGVRDPRTTGHAEALAWVPLDRGGIATSGDYQRCMIVDGRRYAHILDPRSGWPAIGLTSASVVADRCLLAGTASTIAMLKGVAGPDWLDALGLPYLCVDERGAVHGTLAASAGRDRRPGSGYGAAPSVRSPGLRATATSPGNTTT